MNENVVLSLDFKGLPNNYYADLKDLLLNQFRLKESNATVYIGNAGTVRNAISKLNEQQWFQKHVSVAKLIIDGDEFNITEILYRFNRLFIYMGAISKKKRLKQLITSSLCAGVAI